MCLLGLKTPGRGDKQCPAVNFPFDGNILSGRAGLKLVRLVIMQASGHTNPAGADKPERQVNADLQAILGKTQIISLRQVIHLDRVDAEARKESRITGAIEI